MEMLIKDINIRSLVDGSKQARITLETTTPEQIEVLKVLASEMFVNVKFDLENEKDS